MKKLFFVLSLTFLFISSSFSYQIVKLVRIVDGDTLIVSPLDNPSKKIRVRLAYIDTPETYNSYKMIKNVQKCDLTIKTIKSLGNKSKTFLKSILSNYLIINTISKGYYKRYISVIYSQNGTNINLLLLKKGYACYYNTSPFDISYKLAEELAYTKRLGLWSVNYDAMRCLCLQ